MIALNAVNLIALFAGVALTVAFIVLDASLSMRSGRDQKNQSNKDKD
jgi:hypothetical protein